MGFCSHHKNSPDCTAIRDGTFTRGLTEEDDRDLSLSEEEEERDLSLLGCNTPGCFKGQGKGRHQRCFFYGKCKGPEIWRCDPKDVDCRATRNIGGAWFCSHHKNSPDCTKIRDGTFPRGLTEEEEERDLSLLGCNRPGCFKGQGKGRQQRCFFHGKCKGPQIWSCDPNDVSCQATRNIGGAWLCSHHKNSPDCTKIRDGSFPRGLTEEEDDRDLSLSEEEEERDLSLLGCNAPGCFKGQGKGRQQRCFFYGKCKGPEIWRCDPKDVDCRATRNIGGAWF